MQLSALRTEGLTNTSASGQSACLLLSGWFSAKPQPAAKVGNLQVIVLPGVTLACDAGQMVFIANRLHG
jgi:hypothetical protein